MRFRLRTIALTILLWTLCSPVAAAPISSTANLILDDLQKTQRQMHLLRARLQGMLAAKEPSPDDAVLFPFKCEIEKANQVVMYIGDGLSRWKLLEEQGNVSLNCYFEAKADAIHQANLEAIFEFVKFARPVLERPALDFLEHFEALMNHLTGLLVRYDETLLNYMKANRNP